jgi:hypothetical protein
LTANKIFCFCLDSILSHILCSKSSRPGIGFHILGRPESCSLTCHVLVRDGPDKALCSWQKSS